MSDPAFDMTAELTDYRRSFLALGEAFIAAAGRLETTRGRRGVIAALEHELADRDMRIDVLALDTALLCFIGFEAGKTGASPRDVIDEHWKVAPPNETWAQLLKLARNRREETDGC